MNVEKYLKSALNWIILYGPKILLGTAILIAGLYLIKWLSKFLQSAMVKRDFDPSLKVFMISFLIIALRILLVLGVLQIVGIEMTLFAALIGAFGVAAGLALSGTLQNFASGILILLLKPFRVGDSIITQGQEGIVTVIQMFYTTMTTFDNKSVIVPNSKLSNEVIINISHEGKRRLDIELKFNYGINIDQVKEILNNTVNDFKGKLGDTETIIGVSKIDADGYTVMLNIWVNADGFLNTKLAFQEALIYSFKNAGIKLPGVTT